MTLSLTTAFVVATLALVGKIAFDYWARYQEARSIAGALAGEIGAYVENAKPNETSEAFQAWIKISREKRLTLLRSCPTLPSSHPVFDKVADKIGLLPPKAACEVSRFYNIVTGMRLSLSDLSSTGFLEAGDDVHAARLNEVAKTIKQESEPARELIRELRRIAIGGVVMQRGLDIGAALLALMAAVFWFMSAYGKLPPMIPYWDRTPDTDPFYQAIKFSARMNRWGALFSGLSAACVAVRLFMK